MTQTALKVKEQVWRELEGLPETKISKVLEFVQALKAEEKVSPKKDEVLELLGFWLDMPDDFVEEIMASRKSFFTPRKEEP